MKRRFDLRLSLAVVQVMKIDHLFRFPVFLALMICVGTSVSCMTTYDANGNPVQSVDPGLAVAGVAAAGLIGYAAGNNHHSHNNYYGGTRYYRGGGYYAPPRYYRGGGGYKRSGGGGGGGRARGGGGRKR